MIFLWLLILLFFNSIHAQQPYDPSRCGAKTSYPGSRYVCNSNQKSCKTFLVYRANQNFKTISNVSQLFQVDPGKLTSLNKLTPQWETLEEGREVLIPIECSCEGQFFQANFSYIVPENTALPEIACTIFEGLVRPSTLVEQNPYQEVYAKVGAKLQVPLKCACPDNFSSSVGVEYLVTYPVAEGDDPRILSTKFGTSSAEIWVANDLQPWATIYPNTTFLIPLKDLSAVDFNIPVSPPPAPTFLPTITVETKTNTRLRDLYIAGSVVGLSLVLAASIAVGLYIKAIRKRKVDKLLSFNTRSSHLSCSPARSSTPRSGQTARSSTPSCLSPDLLIGIKYSLKNYSIEDLRTATRNFREETKIGDQTYKGLIDNVEMMIKQMRFEETRLVIDEHSKINHINIVNLLGVCYGENDFSWSYLVFELPNKGCLRDCLSNSSASLRWQCRTQIAFDIASGLHYLHYCIFPSYAHMIINSRNIFVTETWRAKLTNIRTNPAIGSIKRNDLAEKSNSKGLSASEHIVNASAPEKEDIFAFGVVLLELISGRQDIDHKSFKDSIAFLGGGATEGGCFEQLKSFMDPCLKEGYPLAEALCLAVLAKACVEDDPMRRPSMDDILKVLGRMV